MPDTHPAASQLEGVFGGHTFFLGPEGLHVIEKNAQLKSDRKAAGVVKLATWEDAEEDQAAAARSAGRRRRGAVGGRKGLR